jgi:hypothetical protein
LGKNLQVGEENKVVKNAKGFSENLGPSCHLTRKTNLKLPHLYVEVMDFTITKWDLQKVLLFDI